MMRGMSEQHHSSIHPEIRERVIAADKAQRANPPHLQSPEQVRAAFLAARRPLVRPPTALQIQDRLLQLGDRAIALRLYRPPEAKAPLPAVAYFHGGGFTNGDLDSHDAVAVALAEHANALVVSVDYRVMPEHHFPAAFDDAVAVLRWMRREAAELGIDAQRIGAGGDSSGANLGMAAALALREDAPLAALWLAYPIIGADFDTPSYRENHDAPLLTRERCQRILRDYLGCEPAEGDWRAIPLQHPDLSGLPPTVALGAMLDPLCSDAEILAERLAAAGVRCELQLAAGMPHGFFRWINDSEACRGHALRSIEALRGLMHAG